MPNKRLKELNKKISGPPSTADSGTADSGTAITASAAVDIFREFSFSKSNKKKIIKKLKVLNKEVSNFGEVLEDFNNIKGIVTKIENWKKYLEAIGSSKKELVDRLEKLVPGITAELKL